MGVAITGPYGSEASKLDQRVGSPALTFWINNYLEIMFFQFLEVYPLLMLVTYRGHGHFFSKIQNLLFFKNSFSI